MNKVIVDDSAKGVVPYFQLPTMQKPRTPQTQMPRASSDSAVTAPDDGTRQ
jgi:hypothetical protein